MPFLTRQKQFEVCLFVCLFVCFWKGVLTESCAFASY